MQEDTENPSSEEPEGQEVQEVQENAETETGLSDAQETDEAVSEEGGAGNKSLDLILDIPLTVTVELGRSKMLINDLLQLGQGSVVELTKLVGEPLEVLVNQKLVARGEVVVVKEKFGVRLTDIITPMERVHSLG